MKRSKNFAVNTTLKSMNQELCWTDRHGYRNEKVFLTYVSPINDYSSYLTEQCIIFQQNEFIKVAYDMFREMNGHDSVSGDVRIFYSIEDLEKNFVIRKDLLWKEAVLRKKRIRKKYYARKYY